VALQLPPACPRQGVQDRLPPAFSASLFDVGSAVQGVNKALNVGNYLT
jgi:hypothetical protein